MNNDNVVKVFVKIFVTARSLQIAKVQRTHVETVYYSAVSPLQSSSLILHIYSRLKCNLFSTHPS
jgi:hypothetical protein